MQWDRLEVAVCVVVRRFLLQPRKRWQRRKYGCGLRYAFRILMSAGFDRGDIQETIARLVNDGTLVLVDIGNKQDAGIRLRKDHPLAQIIEDRENDIAPAEHKRHDVDSLAIEPSMDTLMLWVFDTLGGAACSAGCMIEADGRCVHGFSSWIRVILGI